MAIISGRGGAPGSFIYEGAIASQGARASFNTVYMMVQAPEESSTLTFPFNRPVAINSLNEYENLLGTLPTTAGAALTSYYAVKAFFQQAPVADLRVTRVGTPSVIKEISFNPSAKKDNGVSAPSNLTKGDLVYVKLTINGIELGERTRNNAWLGVAVEVPETYVAGDIDNNLAISNAMRDAVASAIVENSDISAGVYVRELGSGDPSCDDCSYIYLAGRVFNSPVELVEGLTITGNQNILASSGYTIGNITESDDSVYDWIQCARTGFDDPKLSQGYLTAPGAFPIFNQKDRVNLGQTMEEVCADAFHKWLALIDCGPYYVTSIKDYKDFVEHVASDGFEEDDLSLIENVIYRWTDSNPLAFTQAKYEAGSAQRSANASLDDGSRRSLKDNRVIASEVAVSTSTNVVTLSTAWPTNLTSGEKIAVVGATGATAPTYSEAATNAQNADLVGTFYVIASDIDPLLESNEIRLATSRTRALGDQSVDVVTGGTPNGGALLDMEYTTAAWGFDVTIKGKTSDVLEVNNSMGASVNTMHIPASLQKATEKQDFKAYVRQLTNPKQSVGIGGNSAIYFNASAVDATANTFTLPAHGLNTRDKVYVQEVPSATIPAFAAMGPIGAVDFNTPVQSSFDYPNGVYTDIPVNAGTGSGATATVTIVTGGLVAGVEFTNPGENYKVDDEIRFAKGDLGGGGTSQNLVLKVTTLNTPPIFTTSYVIKVDDNTIKLATTEAAAEGGTELDVTDVGTDSATIKQPNGAAAQGIITTGGDALVISADHGLKTAERIYFDGAIGTATTTLFKGTTSTASTLYYVNVVDRNLFTLTPSASNLAAEVFTNFPVETITTTTPVRFYRRMASSLAGGTFSDSGLVRFIRGRKYQMDATLAVFRVKDEAGVGVQTGINNPYGVAYADDLSTDLRLSRSTTPAAIAEYAYNTAAVSTAGDTITIPSHGYVTGAAVRFGEGTNSTLAGGLLEDKVYYVNVVDANTLKFAETPSDAVAGNVVTITYDGLDNQAGVQGIITLDSNPFTFQYTEDDLSYPLNAARDFAGDSNFYCAPLSEDNALMGEVYIHVCLEDSTNITPLYSSAEEIEFVEPKTEVPNALWNFDAITSGDLIAEALRGVNNNGVPQAELIETGMDNHNRLFAESQKFSTTQGFLAYYAPYVLNDVGVYVPPTPFVAGLAMRRYRDEIAGFRLPPAGAKYSLSGARGCQVEITTGMQDVSNPYGLNALRQLPGYSQVDPDTGETYGPVFAWGSRTRINPANAEQALYKFVNTRVIMNVIYGTLDNALDGQIFNIIDGRAVTFNQIRTLISNILYSQFYVPGCLFGSTAASAFDVVVDERNNPAANLENGLVNVQIFVVPVPTLERIEIDLLRVNIGGISDAKRQLNLL